MAKTSTKKRKVIVDSVGEAHVTASFNNIIISLTNKKGDVISWSSAGKMGFRGSKKNTPYAAQLAAEDAAAVAQEAGLKKVQKLLMLLHYHIMDVVLLNVEEFKLNSIRLLFK